MFIRSLFVVSCVLVLVAACGGGGNKGPVCTGTEMSVPRSATDPCDQTQMDCVAAGGTAYATCENGHWPDKCMCIVPQSSVGTTTGNQTAAAMPAICGDTVITPPTESCDRTNLNGATCEKLGYNGGGTLLCNPTTCMYDTIMCRMTVGTSSGAGTSGGAGIGGGGTGS